MLSQLTVIEIITPLALIAGGVLAGLLLEKFLLPRLNRWNTEEILLTSCLKGWVFFWLFLAGIYGAVLATPMRRETSSLLEKVLLVVVIFSVTIFLARTSVRLVDLYFQKTEGAFPSSIFRNLANVVVYVMGILIILQALGISIAPILAALGVGGLAVALALQETLSNLFSGIHLLASRQIKPGDYIELDTGQKGHLEDITWRSTIMRTLPNNLIIIPNSKLASSIITNYGHPEKEVVVVVEVRVTFGSNLEQVEAATIEVAKEVMTEAPGGVPEFEPLVRYHSFGDCGITFTVTMRGRGLGDQYLIKHEFVKRLHRRYQEEKIEIPFPRAVGP